jgi:HEAT repeat protein
MLSLIVALLVERQDIHELIEQLRSDQVEEREEAARTLKDLGRPILPALERASRDQDPEVAARVRQLSRAIQGIEGLTPHFAQSFPELEKKLASGDPREWTRAFLTATRASLTPEDVGPLAARAVLGAATAQEKIDTCDRVRSWGFRTASTEMAGLLKDPDPKVQAAAIGALRELHAAEAVPALVGLLKHPEGGVRIRAVDLLPWLEANECIPAVMALLGDREGGVRGIAAGSLARLQGKEATPKLLLILKFDPAPWVRTQAVQALVNLHGADAAPVVTLLLKDRAPELRKLAVDTLSSFEVREAAPGISRLLMDPSPEVRSAAIDALLHLDSREGQDEIVRLLGDRESAVRAPAARFLGDMRVRQAIPGLLPLLTDGRATVRSSAALALGRLRSAEAIPGLMGLLDDPKTAVQENSLLALYWIGACEAAPAIARRLRGRRPGLDLGFQCTILGEMGAKEAIPDLIGLLKDPEDEVTWAAARALGRMEAQEAVAGLRTMLGHPDPRSRVAAARALSNLRSIDSVPAILKLRDHGVRGICICNETLAALAHMGARETIPVILPLLHDPSVDHRKAAAVALGILRAREASPELIRTLDDAEDLVRTEAARALGRLEAREAAAPLARLVERGGTGAPAAAEALVRLEARDQVGALSKLLISDDEDTRVAAGSALTELGARGGIPVLLQEGSNLTVLNAWRRKDAWGSLSRVRLSLPPRGYTTDALFKELEKRTGMTVQLPESGKALWALEEINWWDDENPCEESVTRILISLERSDVGAILEDGIIRLVRREEALRFWRAWWDAEQKEGK